MFNTLVFSFQIPSQQKNNKTTKVKPVAKASSVLQKVTQQGHKTIMYMYIYIYTSKLMSVYMYIYIYIYMHFSRVVGVDIQSVNTHVFVYVCIYASQYLHIHRYIYIYIYTSIFIPFKVTKNLKKTILEVWCCFVQQICVCQKK